MKKLYFLFAFMVLAQIGFSQLVLNQNFQSNVMPANFTLINDNNTPAANIASLFPTAWSVIGEASDTSNKVAASTSWFTATPVVQADRWMITNQLTVPANAKLAWRGKAQDPAYPDGYSVKISTTGKNKADFTILAANLTAESANWTPHTFNLASYSGQQIYVAFIENSLDMFIILIDDIQVGVGASIEETADFSTTVSVNPNPAQDFMTVNSANKINTVKVMNSIGELVYSQQVDANTVKIDVSSFEAGVYYVTTECNEGTATQKVVVL